MAAKRKTWIEKFQSKEDLPKIIRLDEQQRKKYKAETMLVPSPEMVYDLMRIIPAGKIITVKEIREILAAENGSDVTCPLATGIFIWIAANASVEMYEKGLTDWVIPYWRTLKRFGELVSKYPGGIEAQRRQLEAEGIPVIVKGKRVYVKDYEKFLFH